MLLIEDDAGFGDDLRERLRGAAFAVDHVRTFAEAEHWPDLDKISAIIIDLGAHGGEGAEPESAEGDGAKGEGIDLVRTIRARGIDCPVLMLTTRGDWQDKVAGLNAGADDFLVKPLRFEELLARLHALFRRQSGKRGSMLQIGNLRLDPIARQAEMDGQPLQLSRQEFRLLHLFMRRAGQVLPQPDILEHLYELEVSRELNTVEVMIGRLRRKIGRERITTVRGLGYRFER